jgi:transposase InsO family protein
VWKWILTHIWYALGSTPGTGCDSIKHEFSSPYTPQQNGVVEKKNRTLLDMASTMLVEYNTSVRFWAEAINIACYAINRLYLH